MGIFEVLRHIFPFFSTVCWRLCPLVVFDAMHCNEWVVFYVFSSVYEILFVQFT